MVQLLLYFVVTLLFLSSHEVRYVGNDLKSLQTSSIQGDRLQINMHKTGYRVSIPLTQKALQLLPLRTTTHYNEPVQNTGVISPRGQLRFLLRLIHGHTRHSVWYSP
jgi:hypothetical protein